MKRPAPYLFCGVFSSVALLGARQVLWVLASAVPTALSFALLSTYKWA